MNPDENYEKVCKDKELCLGIKNLNLILHNEVKKDSKEINIQKTQKN